MHGDLQQDPNVLLKAQELIEELTEKKKKKLIAFKGLRKSRSVMEKVFTYGVAIISSILFLDFHWDIAGQPNIFKTTSLRFLENGPDDHTFEFYVYINFLRNNGFFKRFEAPFGKRKFGMSSWDRGLLSKFKHSYLIFKYLLYLKFNS